MDLELLRVNCICNKEYVEKEIESVNEEVEQNFFIYIGIVFYSVILGAGLYSYWL